VIAVKKCKICGLILDGSESDICSECMEYVAMIISASSRAVREMVLFNLIDRIGINEGKTKDSVMREIIEDKRK
jgi:ABC-type ATPase with predicted acetyltransferase domain